MKADTPITLATAKYPDRQLAEEDYESVWSARANDEFDHTAVAVLSKDSSGKLKMDRQKARPSIWRGRARHWPLSRLDSASLSAPVAAQSSDTSITTSRKTRSARPGSFSSPARRA